MQEHKLHAGCSLATRSILLCLPHSRRNTQTRPDERMSLSASPCASAVSQLLSQLRVRVLSPVSPSLRLHPAPRSVHETAASRGRTRARISRPPLPLSRSSSDWKEKGDSRANTAAYSNRTHQISTARGGASHGAECSERCETHAFVFFMPGAAFEIGQLTSDWPVVSMSRIHTAERATRAANSRADTASATHDSHGCSVGVTGTAARTA